MHTHTSGSGGSGMNSMGPQLRRGATALLLVAGAAFADLPTDNLVLRLDSTQIAGPPAEGEWVAIWTAEGGHWQDRAPGTADHFGIDENDPIYHTGAHGQAINGLPVLDFSNSNTLRDEDGNGLGFTGDQPHTMFFVVRLSATSWNTLWLFSDNLNTQNEGYSFHQDTATTARFEGGWGDNLSCPISGVMGVPAIIEVKYDGGGWNGTYFHVYTNGYTTTVTGGSGNPLNFSAESCRLGNFFGRGCDMDVGEVLVYSTALNDATRNQVGAYLQSKWGIAGGYVPSSSGSGVLILLQ